MRLLVFRGRDADAAMRAVRRALGADALILETRAGDDGIEILAAAGEDTRAAGERRHQPADLTPPPPPRGSPLDRRRADLEWHGLRGDLRDALLEPDLDAALARTLRFGSLELSLGAAPLLFAGQPGAGKTLSVIKLATRLVLAGRPPLVIAADGRKAGAIEQLATMTCLLGLTLIVAETPDQLRRAMARRVDGAPVLVDGPGLLLDDPVDAELLGAIGAAIAAEIVLVLPAGLDPDEAGEIARAHAACGARSLLATRLDASRRVGGIVAAVAASGLTLTEYGHGTDPARDLSPLTAATLARRLERRTTCATAPAADHPDGEPRAHVTKHAAA